MFILNILVNIINYNVLILSGYRNLHTYTAQDCTRTQLITYKYTKMYKRKKKSFTN